MLEVSNAAPGPEREILTYTFQVSTTNTFTDLVASTGRIAEDTGGTTQWRFDRALVEDQEYWWRARANDGLFDGPWMAAASFTRGTPAAT